MSEIIKGNQNTTKLINYLKKSAEQYPILTKEQEKEMIKLNRGDRDRLNHLLFMHNIRTVFNQAKSYMSKTDDYDSLVQNGMLGLAEAARRFDPDKDIKFCTYANIWVHKYLSMPYWTAQFKLDRRTISLNQPVSRDGSQDDASGDDTVENCIYGMMEPSMQESQSLVENAVSADEQSEICGELYRWMEQDSSLSAVDKAVFTDLFVEREKASDVAQKYGLKASDVSEVRRRVLGRFRDRLRDKYAITSYSDIA